jgi:signal transduction histidine kinase
MAAILLIVAFQWYWLSRLYKDEWQGLQKETNGVFRDVVYNMQVERFKADTMMFSKKLKGDNLFVYDAVNAIRRETIGFRKDSSVKKNGKFPDTVILPRITKAGVNVIVQYKNASKDSNIEFHKKIAVPPLSSIRPDEIRSITIRNDHFPNADFKNRGSGRSDKAFIQMIANGKVLDDTLPVAKLDSAYKKELSKTGIIVGFSVKMGIDDSLHEKDTVSKASFKTDLTKVGFINPHWYRAEFENPATYLIKKISPQIFFSLFLVAFTTVTFIFLYRNLAAQRKLTEIKNDFISNITHELKTPIATVSVAVEALRNFGGIQRPERTKEYLDISASELQRLSLLVDKVLKLSLFENKGLELKTERFDLKQLTEEVLNTMKLQFEKQQAKIELIVEGQYFFIEADRLHITSVLYNLLDNALKYSEGNPEITVRLIHHINEIEFQVTDKGIGIEKGFKNKIFEKFFRVPTGNLHNVKGYGLGLSYVSHVVKRHNGSITVDTILGKGSTFIVKLPIA